MIWLLSNNRVLKNILIVFVFIFAGGCGMSTDVELKWEWPANRKVDRKILVKITGLKKQGGGLLGIKKSPSIVDNLPDPVLVSGIIINNNSESDEKIVSVIVPELEVKDIDKNSYTVWGLVDNSICICIVPVKDKNVDLEQVDCNKS